MKAHMNIPYFTRYQDRTSYFIVENDLPLFEGHNGYFFGIQPGDRLYFSLEKEANNDANDVNLCRIRDGVEKSEPILLIVHKAQEGGMLNDRNHYAAKTQMENVERIVAGLDQTKVVFDGITVDCLADMLPDGDFWMILGRNSGDGYSIERIEKVGDMYVNITLNARYPSQSSHEMDRKQMAWSMWANANVFTTVNPIPETGEMYFKSGFGKHFSPFYNMLSYTAIWKYKTIFTH